MTRKLDSLYDIVTDDTICPSLATIRYMGGQAVVPIEVGRAMVADLATARRDLDAAIARAGLTDAERAVVAAAVAWWKQDDAPDAYPFLAAPLAALAGARPAKPAPATVPPGLVEGLRALAVTWKDESDGRGYSDGHAVAMDACADAALALLARHQPATPAGITRADLIELALAHAYHHDRRGSFDFDEWQNACALVFGARQDGVATASILNHAIADYRERRQPAPPTPPRYVVVEAAEAEGRRASWFSSRARAEEYARRCNEGRAQLAPTQGPKVWPELTHAVVDTRPGSGL